MPLSFERTLDLSFLRRHISALGLRMRTTGLFSVVELGAANAGGGGQDDQHEGGIRDDLLESRGSACTALVLKAFVRELRLVCPSFASISLPRGLPTAGLGCRDDWRVFASGTQTQKYMNEDAVVRGELPAPTDRLYSAPIGVVGDEVVDGPVLEAAVREVPAHGEGDLLLSQLLLGNLQRVRLVRQLHEDGRIHAGFRLRPLRAAAQGNVAKARQRRGSG